MNRRLQLAGLVVLAVLAALVIALLLRDVVEQAIIRPAVYLFWMLSVLYGFIPQPVLWLLLVLVMIYLALGNLASKLEPPAPRPHRPNPVQGPVAALANKIERKQGGIYFKWQIARILGQIAMDMQELRLHTRSRVLDGDTATPQVRHYLDSGLNTSFSDYPRSGGLTLPAGFSLRRRRAPGSRTRCPILGIASRIFNWTGLGKAKSAPYPKYPSSGTMSGTPSTPFDGDIGPVIDFLESEMENDDDLRRP